LQALVCTRLSRKHEGSYRKFEERENAGVPRLGDDRIAAMSSGYGPRDEFSPIIRRTLASAT
jgi:hypothetical protein